MKRNHRWNWLLVALMPAFTACGDDDSTPPDGSDGLPPTATVSDAAPAPASAPARASSPAKAWFYEARISGGGVTVASAAVALEPLEPELTQCYVERQQVVPKLEGSVFLSALVRPDGSVIGTAVNSSIADPPLMSCLERALADLRFAAWGKTGAGVSDVVIPVVLRVEKGSPGR